MDLKLQVKFLCSFGGIILPRPSDQKLRYVGGATHILWIDRKISLHNLMKRTTALYDQAHKIKYQLPGEDLDVLVSVACNEDLQIMMEAFDKDLQTPRIFLISSSPYGLKNMIVDSELKNLYVVSVNGAGMLATEELPKIELLAPADGAFGSIIPMVENDYILPTSSLQQMVEYDYILPTSSLQIIRSTDLEVVEELGSGAFGAIYRGKWNHTDVIIKQLKEICCAQNDLTVQFWQEVEILSKLNHPNVVSFYGAVQDSQVAVLTEFMQSRSLRNDSVRMILKNRYRYDNNRNKLKIALDAACGLEYLHSNNFVHKDLKSNNLLLNLKDTSRPTCKVGDFGLFNFKIRRHTGLGSLPWEAPELHNGSRFINTKKVDVYAFGVVLWEIFTLEEPYAKMCKMHGDQFVRAGIKSGVLRPPVPRNCDSEWTQLMQDCWAAVPSKRPPFSTIVQRLRAMLGAAN